MNVVLAKTGTGRVVDSLFTVARDRLPGTGEVPELRRQAFEAYERSGLPHRRVEEWKYTDLRVLLREVVPPAARPDAAALQRARAAMATIAIEGATRLVLVDGIFVRELSDAVLPPGVSLRSLHDSLADGASDPLKCDIKDAMISLNAALATDGVVIVIADGTALSGPLQLVHVATASGASAFTRSQVTIGKDARVTLVENFFGTEGAKAYQAHDAVSVSVGDGAELTQVRLLADGTDAANISSAIFAVGARVKFNLFNLTAGGAVSRYQGFVTLTGEGSDLNVNGVNLLKGAQHGDTTLVIDHAVPHCRSRELFRAVVDDRAHSVFQGRIIVRPGAQKTDGKMMSRALLLSDEAEADNKPELEIFADDVTCGHGATAGALDESLLFYLRARGLPEKAAQALLIQAFVGEAIEGIADDTLREAVMAVAERWLEARA